MHDRARARAISSLLLQGGRGIRKDKGQGVAKYFRRILQLLLLLLFFRLVFCRIIMDAYPPQQGYPPQQPGYPPQQQGYPPQQQGYAQYPPQQAMQQQSSTNVVVVSQQVCFPVASCINISLVLLSIFLLQKKLRNLLPQNLVFM